MSNWLYRRTLARKPYEVGGVHPIGTQTRITPNHAISDGGTELLDMKSIAQRFVRFAEDGCRDSSPLYGYLSRRIAGECALLELGVYNRVGHPRATMVFTAVHTSSWEV